MEAELFISFHKMIKASSTQLKTCKVLVYFVTKNVYLVDGSITICFP